MWSPCRPRRSSACESGATPGGAPPAGGVRCPRPRPDVAVHPVALPASDPFSSLTAREREILALLTEGRSNADIAERLVLSEKTVRNHLSGIFEKLGVSNRVEAAAWAARQRRAPLP